MTKCEENEPAATGGRKILKCPQPTVRPTFPALGKFFNLSDICLNDADSLNEDDSLTASTTPSSGRRRKNKFSEKSLKKSATGPRAYDPDALGALNRQQVRKPQLAKSGRVGSSTGREIEAGAFGKNCTQGAKGTERGWPGRSRKDASEEQKDSTPTASSTSSLGLWSYVGVEWRPKEKLVRVDGLKSSDKPWLMIEYDSMDEMERRRGLENH